VRRKSPSAQINSLEKTALKMVLAGDPSLNDGIKAFAELSLEFEQLKWALRYLLRLN
jgi:hypothetical protein